MYLSFLQYYKYIAQPKISAVHTDGKENVTLKCLISQSFRMYVCVRARAVVYTSYVGVQGELLTLKNPPMGLGSAVL